MTEPTGCAVCCARADIYCFRCDLLVGLPGLHVVDVVDVGERLTVTVESAVVGQGCRACGVIAVSRGRRSVILVDAPCFGRPVRLVWRKRTWRCREPGCVVGSFTEQDEQVARPRGLLTVRAAWWAIGHADDPARFDGVTTLGVDEHIWHHVNERDRGPRALTGMVDLTRDQAGRTRARLLDLPARPGRRATARRTGSGQLLVLPDP